MNTLSIISVIIIALFDLAGEAQAATPLNEAQWYYCDWYIEQPSNMAYFYDGSVGVLVAKDDRDVVVYAGLAYNQQSLGEFESYGLNEWLNTFEVYVTPPESDTYTVEGDCELKPL